MSMLKGGEKFTIMSEIRMKNVQTIMSEIRMENVQCTASEYRRKPHLSTPPPMKR